MTSYEFKSTVMIQSNMCYIATRSKGIYDSVLGNILLSIRDDFELKYKGKFVKLIPRNYISTINSYCINFTSIYGRLNCGAYFKKFDHFYVLVE